MSDPLRRLIDGLQELDQLRATGTAAYERAQNFISKQQQLANESEYKRSHWGQEGPRRGTVPGSVANHAQGVIELGELYEVAYLTRKGKDRKVLAYTHKFDAPYPLLTYASDGSGLVIVRAKSDYTVTERGIEG